VIDLSLRWQVLNADCLDVLRELPDGCVDAIVTDPPFGIGFKYATHIDSPDGYGEWLWERIERAEAASRDGAAMFVWQAMLNVRQFHKWFPREWRLFAAAKNFVQMRPTAMQYSFDPVVVWWKGISKPFSTGTASRDFHIADTTPRSPGDHDYVRGHPCPRPLDQVKHIIGQWVPPGGIVLDPFCGSGTTGVACMQTGRRFIGIEIDAGYAEIARRRIADAATSLFDAPPAPKADVQVPLF